MTLLNVDVKIGGYVLAKRLQMILGKIINGDQSGYIKNRYIGLNIRLIEDIIEYSDKLEIDSAILFLDFKKAFDMVEWNFMLSVLEYFGLTEDHL